MPLKYEKPNIILGSGRIFISRYDGSVLDGFEHYVGDAVAATISATTERTTIFSGSGAVATKVRDKVTQVDRVIGFTPQDASLDNMALFLIASRPEQVAAGAEATIARAGIKVSGITERDHIQIEAGAAAPKYSFGNGWAATFTMGDASAQAAAFATLGASEVNEDRVILDQATGRFKLTKAGITALANNTHLKVSITKVSKSAFSRVEATGDSKEVRVALRYLEEDEDAAEPHNIYVPDAVISPAGEAALMSRDTAQQFPLTLGIQEPDGDQAQLYIDGVPS